MRLTWNELTVSPEGVDLDGILSEWRWLADESFQPVVITALGDLLLRHDAGRIFWLESGWWRLSEVAPSAEEFKRLMVQPEHADEWFVPQLVHDLLTAGRRLGPGECFGYKVPPILGGEVDLDNFEPTDLQVHFGILGQIHRQVKDLPPGTPIGEIRIE
ncbi:MAG: DUF1851 domain-containing protein [Gemmataceae bacterium]